MLIKNKKKYIKIFVDILLLVNIEETGRLFHEIFGITMFILLTIHIMLNIKWVMQISKNLNKVKLKTKIMFVIDIITMLIYFGAIIFGLLISNELLRTDFQSNIYLTIIHILLGRLTIIIMFIHIGMHLDMMFKRIKNNNVKILLYIIYVIISVITSIYSIFLLTHNFKWMYVFGGGW